MKNDDIPVADENSETQHIWHRNFLLPAINKVIAWGMLFSALYLLRSFFLMIFFTFVFAYIQMNGVKRLEKIFRNRTLRVVIIAAMILGLLIASAVFLVPKVKKQTEIFVSQFSEYIARMDQELFKIGSKYPILKEIIPELKNEKLNNEDRDKTAVSIKSPTMSILQQMTGFGEEASDVKHINQAIEKLRGVSSMLASISSAFLLSLLFSFLIVLDMPNLVKKVTDLQNTRLRFIYVEVAEGINNFGSVLGRSLEAQLIIAIINSILTAVGISLLGLAESIAFLSVIVFFCSFIPVAGVFISSVPICLIALQTSGLHTMLLAIVMIMVIHVVEGYILNPRIYGSYMRINPVIILIILTIGGKLFHLWGLILGVPVCTYIFGHAIKRADEKNIKETITAENQKIVTK